ncbi:hypothetical protein MRX96_044749 [Rhipicephalus microplus]
MGKWAKYARNYKKEWEKEPDFKDWLSPSNSGDMAYCRACKVELRPHVQDLKLHSTRVKHANNMKRSAGPAAGPLASFVDRRPREPCSSSSDDLKVAELRLAAHLAVHGSFLTADHLTPVISGCFSDSVLASAVTLGRTKCAVLVTKAARNGSGTVLVVPLHLDCHIRCCPGGITEGNRIEGSRVADSRIHSDARMQLRPGEGTSSTASNGSKMASSSCAMCPKDRPRIQVFTIKGLSVDVASSNDTTAVLDDVQHSASGNYSCEVSAEAPTFDVGVAEKRLVVAGE